MFAGFQTITALRGHCHEYVFGFLVKQHQNCDYFEPHDNFNTDKVCNSANPTQVGFVHIYEPCILVSCILVKNKKKHSTLFTSYPIGSLNAGLIFKTGFCVPSIENISSGKVLTFSTYMSFEE